MENLFTFSQAYDEGNVENSFLISANVWNMKPNEIREYFKINQWEFYLFIKEILKLKFERKFNHANKTNLVKWKSI